MTGPRDTRDERIEEAARQSAQQFLDGHLSPEEERHAHNIGRVCLEFACLEEAIGELGVASNHARSGSHAYMTLVKTGSGVKKTIRELAKADSRWETLDAAYDRFKVERDRYAHASVGTVLEEREAEDGGRPVIHILTDLQKHPKGDQHRLGHVSALPTDRQTDDLIKEMRELRLALLESKTNVTFTRALRNMMPDLEGLTRGLVRPMFGSLMPWLRGGDR